MKTSPGKWIASCLAGSLTKSAYVFTHAPFKLFIPHWDSEIGRFFALYEQSFLLPSGSFIYKPHWPLMLKVRGGLYSCNSRNHSTKCKIRAVFRPFVGLGNKYGTWAQWQLRIKGGNAPRIHFRCSSQTLGAVSLCSLSRHLLAKFGGKMRMYVFLFWPVQSNVMRDSPCGTLVHHHHRCRRC